MAALKLACPAGCELRSGVPATLGRTAQSASDLGAVVSAFLGLTLSNIISAKKLSGMYCARHQFQRKLNINLHLAILDPTIRAR
jgi:hypothetical protein